MVQISLGKVFFGTFIVSSLLTARLFYKGVEKSEFLFTVILVLTLILSLILMVYHITSEQHNEVSSVSEGLLWVKDKLSDLCNKGSELSKKLCSFNERLDQMELTTKSLVNNLLLAEKTQKLYLPNLIRKTPRSHNATILPN